jgi:hypothetical protein
MSRQESKLPILDNEEFGSEKLNNFYKKLDKSVKKKIIDMNKESAIQLLEIMSNPNIQDVYDGLTQKEKDKLKKNGLVEKYTTLKEMLDKKVKETTFVLETNQPNKINGPRTPDDTPPPLNVIQEKKDKEEKRKRCKNGERRNKLGECVKKPSEPITIIEDDEVNEIQQTNAAAAIEIEQTNAEEIEEEEKSEKHDKKHHERFYNIVKTYCENNQQGELEVKFGTKGANITKNNYDNVVKKLKSLGFRPLGEENGEYYLRINCEFLDSVTGRFKMSNIRTEIRSLVNIQKYCETNNIKNLPQPLFVEHLTKGPMFINKEKIFPVDFYDFNFRITYSEETAPKMGVVNNLLENWRKSKKEFRLLNRVTFHNTEYPFRFDLSIVKYGTRQPDKFGRKNKGPMIHTYTLEESNVLNGEETYEIEIEIDNTKVGPGTKFNTPQTILDSLRKGIKYVLCGMQRTNYPVSYTEQKSVLESYMRMIWKEKYDSIKYVSSRYFIGPNSYTLQIENIAANDENSNYPNIRKDFVVTDKADGERHLLYINNDGRLYLINTNMDVIFTGARTDNEDCFNSLMDGELILHDKNGKYINLYAAFDIYYIKKEDIRAYTFLLKEGDKKRQSRIQILHFIRQNLNAVAVTNINKTNRKTPTEFKTMDGLVCPLRFSVKEFFPNHSKDGIFQGCRQILDKEKGDRFEYTTDGLIFTHAFYGVGSNEVGRAGPKEKITWEYSFKWKPPQYNTIDFLVTTIKGSNGQDTVKKLFEDGQNNHDSVQLNEYKQVVLRCGFNEKRDGFINPCQNIIDDKLPEYQPHYEDRNENDYVPQQFYPTDPYDVNAGLCNIMLRTDSSGSKKMFSEENQVFEDNTIVEFRYDITKEDLWKWIPLRVRYDKTSRLMKGEREYGNAYHVCNSNWKSIHPSGRITEDMLATGMDIPDITVSEDKYYNTPTGKFKTNAMKQFHNLYVKKHLIVGTTKQGDTLIDLACGKAGDLPKWIHSRLSFVFGVDISEDNLENRLDGACARFLKARKVNKHVPYALFVNGNSSYNIQDGSAMRNEKAKQITLSVFGKGPKEASKIGPGVVRQYGKGVDGFNVSSCQFALHYFFETPDTLKGFVKNIAECTKLNGYFIGTAYDGKSIFNELKRTPTGDSIKIVEDEKKIWEIIKRYRSETFEDDSSCIGYRIDVFQESINQSIPEYLINFDYLNRIMSAYGFEIISREEANEFGLPEGSGMFSELFLNMLDEIKKNKFKIKDYGDSHMMTANEKHISFLNRYFVYKKIRIVNTDKVELELGEYYDSAGELNAKETKHAVKVAEETNIQTAPKIRKLSRKLLLVAATEAIDEPVEQESIKVVEETKKPKQTKKEPKQTKKKEPKKKEPKKVTQKIIIESDEED